MRYHIYYEIFSLQLASYRYFEDALMKKMVRRLIKFHHLFSPHCPAIFSSAYGRSLPREIKLT